MLGPSHSRQQEDDAGMHLDFAISAAKFDRVVGHQNPVLFGNDFQQILVRLRAQAQVIDVHRLEPSPVRGLN